MRIRRAFPEVVAGGFSRRDGTIQFYTRVRSLLGPDSVVADLGAGRGEWNEDPVTYRRDLRRLRGSVADVVGVDIDEAVLVNPSCDRAVLMPDGCTIPLPTGTIDVIVSDHTFEHVEDPPGLVASMLDVLRPGGWVCARTPNRWGYIGLAANIVPNRMHARALRRLQPDRKAVDIFPTRYRMNTKRDLRRVFSANNWDLVMYGFNPEPAYFGTSASAIRAVDAVAAKVPEGLSATWHIFARKR